jgi:hypothetical protein
LGVRKANGPGGARAVLAARRPSLRRWLAAPARCCGVEAFSAEKVGSSLGIAASSGARNPDACPDLERPTVGAWLTWAEPPFKSFP